MFGHVLSEGKRFVAVSGVGGIERKTSEVGDGYAWSDVAEWVPERACQSTRQPQGTGNPRLTMENALEKTRSLCISLSEAR